MDILQRCESFLTLGATYCIRGRWHLLYGGGVIGLYQNRVGAGLKKKYEGCRYCDKSRELKKVSEG